MRLLYVGQLVSQACEALTGLEESVPRSDIQLLASPRWLLARGLSSSLCVPLQTAARVSLSHGGCLPFKCRIKESTGGTHMPFIT